MKKRSNKEMPKLPKPWKPTPFQPRPSLHQLPPPASHKTSESTCTPGNYRREVFAPVLSRPIELEKLVTGVIFRLHGIDGEREIQSCYGDVYKVINALMDYARILELSCEAWDLQGYHRGVYEIHAEKLRSIAKKYQAAIGYDYDAAVAKCEARKKKAHKDDDIGGDPLELAMKRGQQKTKKSSDKKQNGGTNE